MARYTKYRSGKIIKYKPYNSRRLKRKRRDYAFKKAKRAAKSVILRQAETKCFRSFSNLSGIPSSTGGGGPGALTKDNIAVYNVLQQGVSSTTITNALGEDDVVGAQIRTLWLKVVLTCKYEATSGQATDTMFELSLVAADDYIAPYNNGNFSNAASAGAAQNWWIFQGTGQNIFDVTFNSRYVTVLKQKRVWIRQQGLTANQPVSAVKQIKMKMNLKGNRRFRGEYGSGVGSGNQLKGKNFYIIVRQANAFGANPNINIVALATWHLYYKDI